ncbi:MAG: dihydroneopterin aldolase, partial [bacterium]|nr:dihydroneopterin aldolase [bacterium]
MSEVLITSGGTAPGESGDSITLKGLRIEAHHGVLAEERREGQPFVVDVTLWMDLSEAGEHDELAATIDYGKLATEIHRRVSGERWNLIEKVAERVARLVLEDGRVSRVAVTVHKPRAPIDVEFEDVSVTVVRSSHGTRAAIALGTNLGDRAANLVNAMEGIRLVGRVVASSSVYETAPQGVVDQEHFYNAVVLVDTDLDPVELVGRLLDIEREMGRVRGPRWGPRLIDLDLILYGDR